MMTSLRTLGLALVAIIPMSLAGCTLYFDDGSSGGRGWDDGSSSNGSGGGYYCSSNRDCAAGCYCEESSGTCSEAGFCQTNADCGTGYVCDAPRNSCEPGSTCTADTDCAAGSICTDGTCTASCACTTDAEAQAAGFGYCDETRGTCEPPAVAGSCGGTLTPGGLGAPQCAEGQVPLIKDGAYTGQCQAIATCDVVPGCTAFQHEADCLNPNDTDSCGAAYIGRNCTTPTGSSCTTGDGSNCTCTSYEYATCASLTPNGTRTDSATGKALQSFQGL